MVAIEKSFCFIGLKLKAKPSHLYLEKNRSKCATTLAKRRRDEDLSEDSRTQPKNFPLTSRVFSNPNKVLAQSVAAVFGLGFIDAGYSGDWSRIGVISKETEELLKFAAFVVIPLCFFLIFSISKED